MASSLELRGRGFFLFVVLPIESSQKFGSGLLSIEESALMDLIFIAMSLAVENAIFHAQPLARYFVCVYSLAAAFLTSLKISFLIIGFLFYSFMFYRDTSSR